MNIKILVCCHKECPLPQSNSYLPIHVGKAMSNADLNIQGDDTGENISSKNASYCEMTGMYWAWKNLKGVDVIGLCHYRRYFDYYGNCDKGFPYTQFSPNSLGDINLSVPDHIIKKIESGEIVVPEYWHYYQNLRQDYCYCHNSDDYKVMTEVINETQPQYIVDAYHKVMSSNKLIHYNMFLMRWVDFDSYCRWIFPILKEIENRIDITHYNAIQKRVFGYMAERLFTVWIKSGKKRIMKKPIIWIVDDPVRRRHGFIYLMRNFFWDFVNKLTMLSQRLSNATD